MDWEFECICYSIPEEVNLNTTATNDHVPQIKHKNCVIKDHARALISTFPFKKISGRITIELIRFLGIWLNQKPSENGVPDVNSPQNVIMGQYLTYEKHCKFIFG